MTTFPMWLQQEMDIRGWSQADLSRKAGITTSTVSNLLNEMRKPGDEICRALSRALGIPQVEVFVQAGLITEPPRAQEDWDYKVARYAARLMALPPAERDRLLALGEQMADMLEEKKGG